MLESYKFGVGPLSCVRFDCRHRKKTETSISWFFWQDLVEILTFGADVGLILCQGHVRANFSSLFHFCHLKRPKITFSLNAVVFGALYDISHT